jgi:hypothetical protein
LILLVYLCLFSKLESMWLVELEYLVFTCRQSFVSQQW